MSITLTDVAAERVQAFMQSNTAAVGLRVGISTAGCSGYMYQVELVEAVGDNDAVFEDHGIQLIVDKESLDYLNGTIVDYGKEGLNEGFKFENPNAKATCGCGESFSV